MLLYITLKMINSKNLSIIKQTKVIIIIISMICLSLEVQGQTTEERVQSFFEETEPIKWCKFFRGRMNDINDVMIALGSNGKQYKGIMKYLRSNAEFLVEGNVNGKQLELLEKDTLGNTTGIITGIIEDFEGIEAKWFNHDRSVGNDLQLIPYRQEPRYPTYCGDNKWIRLYNGVINDETVEFILKRGSGFRVDGLAYFQKQDKTFAVEGELTNHNQDIKLKLQDNDWEHLGVIEGKVDFKTDKIAGFFIDKKGDKSISVLTKDQTISVGCIEYADFISEMEVTYPKTRSLKFNDMLNDYIQSWLKTSREYTKQYKAQMKTLKPTMRASLRSYFWCDIDYYSSNIISGKAIHTNTWENGYDSYVFNFDFQNNKIIELVDIFKTESEYDAFIQQYIQEAMKKRPFSKDPMFQKWIAKAKFDYFTIRKEGINFTSEFNAIYGEQHCTIPYEALKPYLKKISAVADLVE